MNDDQRENLYTEEKTAQYNNTRRSVITPILFALVLAGGIFLGNMLAPRSTNKPTFILPSEANKLGAILSVVEENYVDSVDKAKIVEKTIPELLKNLDPHSTYIPASDVKEVNAPLEGNFDGIGVQFNVQEDTILVVNTIPGGPSEKVGILPGDRIVMINDSLFAGKGISDQDVIKNLKGPRGTTVKVGVARRGESKLIDFEITRDQIPIHSLDVAYMASENVGYVKISRFARTTHEEFVEAAEDLLLEGMEKLILDLRGNSGGYLDAAIGITDEFLEKGKLIVYTEGYSRPKASYYSTDGGSCKDVEVIVLIDAWSASASEIVSGAIQDNDRGLIVGRRSFGKGLVQEPTFFRDGSVIRLTVSRYYTPTGRCIQKSYQNGNSAYYKELTDRFTSGEFDSLNISKFPDSLRYTTPKGKVVYGGGGIMPDVFVPIDTVGNSDYFIQAVRKGLIYRYALHYTDNHRNELKGFKSQKLISDYLRSQNLLDSFVSFAETKGLKRNIKDISESRQIMLTQIHAYIARNIIDNKGFYPILHEIDKGFQKALEIAIGNPSIAAK